MTIKEDDDSLEERDEFDSNYHQKENQSRHPLRLEDLRLNQGSSLRGSDKRSPLQPILNANTNIHSD